MIQKILNNKMMMKPLLKGFIGISFLILFSCTSPEKVVFSPTSGFGGTGNLPSGFGGTGIVGTITEFGSIWVNGVEIEYDENIQVTSNLSAIDTLKLGGQVVLETLQNSDKTKTRKITIYYPVAGKITQLGKSHIILNNHFVIKTTKAKLDEGVQLMIGEYVAINGFEISSNTWVATRINANPQHKVFYQETPALNFSKSVKQVLIESSASQLKKWKGINGLTDKLTNNLDHIILVGRIDDHGDVQVHAVHSYHDFPKSATKKSMLIKYKHIQGNKPPLRKGKTNHSRHGGGFSRRGSGYE